MESIDEKNRRTKISRYCPVKTYGPQYLYKNEIVCFFRLLYFTVKFRSIIYDPGDINTCGQNEKKLKEMKCCLYFAQ
jgi:hypothetical protein